MQKTGQRSSPIPKPPTKSAPRKREEAHNAHCQHQLRRHLSVCMCQEPTESTTLLLLSLRCGVMGLAEYIFAGIYPPTNHSDHCNMVVNRCTLLEQEGEQFRT